jgi:hypothetical protein
MQRVVRVAARATAVALLVMLLGMGAAMAQGPQLGGKLITGSEVTIATGQTVDHDLYVFGGTVISNGTINGDVVVAGGNIDINGPVSGDIVAAGGRVSINGNVGGAVRVAGGQVSVNGNVTRDVAVAGGQLSVDGKVGQDLIVGAGQLTLAGAVAGSTAGSAGTYAKSGTVGGTDSITVTGNQPAPIVRRNPVLDAIRQFIAVLIVALVVMWIAPRLFANSEERVRREPIPSLAWGVLACIGYFVAVILLLIVVIIVAVGLGALGFGALLGIDLLGGFVAISGLTLAFIIGVGFLADAVVGLAIGRLLAGQMTRRTTTETPTGTVTTTTVAGDRWADLGVLALGVAIVVIVTSLPVIGGWVKLIVAFVGLGALWLAWRRGGTSWWRPGTVVETTAPPPPPPAPA